MNTQCHYNSLFGVMFVFFYLMGTPFSHADGKGRTTGFVDLNVYPYLSDVDQDNLATLNIAVNFKNRFSYFSLTNLGRKSRANGLGDATTYYTEQNLRWKITKESPLDLTLQLNFRSGTDNDRYRLGIRWRLNDTAFLSDFFSTLNARYAINLHAVQFDHEEAYVWQLEHAFGMTFPDLSDRLYLAGFMDHTFNQDLADSFPTSPIVAEVQLGFHLIEGIYAIAEYRINEYRLSEVDNLAIGVEYKVQW